jgi:16S rRNA (adenine1518-N6/adenine1519-N6)-dimethyltransferase
MTFEAKKSLGQNFLHAPHIVGAMVHAARVDEAAKEGAMILEVGPGKGVLTEALLASSAHIVAVEKDDRAIPFLQEKFAGSIASGKLELIHGDILDIEKIGQVDFLKKNAGNSKYIVVANIPYYITGELLRMFLESERQPARMVLMVQKEVADRIVTRGDNGRLDGKESILSISVKVFGEPKYIVTVPAKNFRPEPNVDSAVILIDNISRAFFDNMALNMDNKEIVASFFKLVKTGFAHKRKVLIGNLSQIIPRDVLENLWTTCGFNPKVRAEEISVENWGKMLVFLTAHKVIV